MIKSVEIKNIQSHENSTIEFSKGVNIIVGKSDTGKSAILRALRLLVWNRPSGSAIRSNWGGKSLVKLVTEDGEVIRSKDKQDTYILRINGQKDIEFKAFSTSVPEEITRFLNINEINLQMQLDRPFLLDETAGAVATHFNKVAKLTKIDTGTSNIKSAITKLNQSINSKKEDLKSKKEELTKFKYLDKLEIEVEILEAMNKQLTSLRNSKLRLQAAITDYECNVETINDFSLLLEFEKPLDKVLGRYDTKYKLSKKQHTLETLLQDIVDVGAEINEQNQVIKKDESVTSLLQLYKSKNEKYEEYKPLSNLLSNIKQTRGSILKAEQKYKALCSKFNKLFPQQCPLCGLFVPHDKKLKFD